MLRHDLIVEHGIIILTFRQSNISITVSIAEDIVINIGSTPFIFKMHSYKIMVSSKPSKKRI